MGVDAKAETLAERLNDLRERYPLESFRDRFPGDEGSFAVDGGELAQGRWGLQPFWAKDASFGRKNAYNARSETLAEKPTFRTALRHRRCVLPAVAFYERAEGHWLRVSPKQGNLFLFAGLSEEPNEHTQGLPTYTMVTTGPNEAIGKVHDQMPVVLSPEDAADWMSPDAVLDELRVTSTVPARMDERRGRGADLAQAAKGRRAWAVLTAVVRLGARIKRMAAIS